MSATAEFELDLEYSLGMPQTAYQYPDFDATQYMYDKPVSQTPGMISDALSDEPLIFEDEKYFDPSSQMDNANLRPTPPQHNPVHHPHLIRPAPVDAKHPLEYLKPPGSNPSLPAVQDLGICEPLKWQQGAEPGLKVRKRPSVARIAKKPSLKQLVPKRSMNNLNETIKVRSPEDFLKQNPSNSQPVLHRTVQPRTRRVSAPASAAQRPQMPSPSTAIYNPVFISPSSSNPKTPLKQHNLNVNPNSPTTVIAPTPSQWRPMNHSGPSPTPAMRYKSTSKLVSEASEFSPAKGVWHQKVQSNPSTPSHAQNRAGLNRPPPVQLNLPRSPRKSASTSNMRREMRKKTPKMKDMNSAMNQFQVDLNPKTFTSRPHKPHKPTQRGHKDGSGPFDTLQNLDSRNHHSHTNPAAPRSAKNASSATKSVGNLPDRRSANNSYNSGSIAPNTSHYTEQGQYPQPVRISNPNIVSFDSDNWYPEFPSRDSPKALMMESQQLQNRKHMNSRLNRRLDGRSDRPRIRAVASQPSFSSNELRAASKMYSLPSIETEEEFYTPDLQLNGDQPFNPVNLHHQPPHHESANISMPYPIHDQHLQHHQKSEQHLESVHLNSAHLIQPQLDQLSSQSQPEPLEPRTPEDFTVAPPNMLWPNSLANTSSLDDGLDESTMNISHDMSHGMSHSMTNNRQFTQESTLLATGLDDVDEFSNWNTVNALDLDSPWNFMDSIPDGL